MLNVGVSVKRAEKLTPERQVSAQAFLQTMARLEPELLHAFITETGQNGGTRSSFSLDGSEANIAVLSQRDNVSFAEGPIILAHEMGHFLGLKHSHGKGNPLKVDELAFNVTAMLEGKWGAAGVDAFAKVADYSLGPKLQNPLVPDDLFVPYNGLVGEDEKFTDFISALIDVYVLPDQLYRLKGSERQGLPTNQNRLRQLRRVLAAGETLYWKVIAKKFEDKSRLSNCKYDLDDLDGRMLCTYGDVSVWGDDLLLDDLVMLDGGRRSDLMSYVVPFKADGSPNWNVADPQKGITPNQIKLVQVYVNSPWMGAYWNFGLEGTRRLATRVGKAKPDVKAANPTSAPPNEIGDTTKAIPQVLKQPFFLL